MPAGRTSGLIEAESIDDAEHNSMLECVTAARHDPAQPETNQLLPIAS